MVVMFIWSGSPVILSSIPRSAAPLKSTASSWWPWSWISASGACGAAVIPEASRSWRASELWAKVRWTPASTPKSHGRLEPGWDPLQFYPPRTVIPGLPCPHTAQSAPPSGHRVHWQLSAAVLHWWFAWDFQVWGVWSSTGGVMRCGGSLWWGPRPLQPRSPPEDSRRNCCLSLKGTNLPQSLKKKRSPVKKNNHSHLSRTLTILRPNSPVSLLQKWSAASLWLSPFSSVNLWSRLLQESRWEPRSSAGVGGKLPSRDWLQENDIWKPNGLDCKWNGVTTKKKVQRYLLAVPTPAPELDQLENTLPNNGTKLLIPPQWRPAH